MFQSVTRYFKNVVNSNHISALKSKGYPDESIKPLVPSNNKIAVTSIKLY